MWLAVLAAPLGTLIGAILHEISHAVAAELLGGTVVGAGWRGGLTGGPYVRWEAPNNESWRVRAVGIAPVVTAAGIALLGAKYRPHSLPMLFAIGGMLAGLTILSQEDVDPKRSQQTAQAQY